MAKAVMMPLWALRVLPYGIAVVAGCLALWWAYDNGRDSEREKWRIREAKAVEAQRARETELRSQVDAAAVALSVSSAEIERLSKRNVGNVRNYYAANPVDNGLCIKPERVQHIAEADSAAIEATTAAR